MQGGCNTIHLPFIVPRTIHACSDIKFSGMPLPNLSDAQSIPLRQSPLFHIPCYLPCFACNLLPDLICNFL